MPYCVTCSTGCRCVQPEAQTVTIRRSVYIRASMSDSLRANIWLSVPLSMYVVYHDCVSVCM